MKYLILAVVCTLMLFVTIQRRAYEQNPPQLPLMAIGSETNPTVTTKLDFTMPARVREVDESSETRFAIQVRCLRYTRAPNTDALFDKLFAASSSEEATSETIGRQTFKSRVLKSKSIGPSITRLLSSDQSHLGRGQTRISYDGQPVTFAQLDRTNLTEVEAFQQCVSPNIDSTQEGDRHQTAVETFDWKQTSSLVMTTTLQSSNKVRVQASTRNSKGTPVELDSIQLLQPGQTIAVWGEPLVRNAASTSIVPLMGNLPVIGDRFKKTTVTKTTIETVYLITAELIPAHASNP
ncbi:hypothetical protein [Schlesneria paludicola]|uniref:hypothetical protein n=1 Tax=Schlesneria paludicola TaxID=360056 RepID=UPI00029AA7BB|nr:hypothetical protein [Schlesneria paludicola]